MTVHEPGFDIQSVPAVDHRLHDELKGWLGAGPFAALLDQCWRDADEVLDDLAEGEREKARERMRAAAHRLRGLALSFGYPHLAGLAGRLESACLNADGALPHTAEVRTAAAVARLAGHHEV